MYLPDQVLNFEIFKTNVQNKKKAERLIKELSILFPLSQINFDLSDCDKILRVKGNDFNIEVIKETLINSGHECEIIE